MKKLVLITAAIDAFLLTAYVVFAASYVSKDPIFDFTGAIFLLTLFFLAFALSFLAGYVVIKKLLKSLLFAIANAILFYALWFTLAFVVYFLTKP